VLHDDGFKIGNKVTWEQFGANADRLVLVTSVPLSASKTYVSVVASSNNQASAQMWAPRIFCDYGPPRASSTSRTLLESSSAENGFSRKEPKPTAPLRVTASSA
jgi:hypothetical protein